MTAVTRFGPDCRGASPLPEPGVVPVLGAAPAQPTTSEISISDAATIVFHAAMRVSLPNRPVVYRLGAGPHPRPPPGGGGARLLHSPEMGGPHGPGRAALPSPGRHARRARDPE